LGDSRRSVENGVDTVQADAGWELHLDLVFVINELRRPGKGSRTSDLERSFPEEPFINLSSTAAWIRRLFALKHVIAAI
jgi:hypothetical protein